MRNKPQNALPDNMSISLTLNILVTLPDLDYNIMEDMKKTHANINFSSWLRFRVNRDILLCALGQTSTSSVASTSKGARTSPSSLTTMLNTLWMEEENFVFPPFLLSFEIFNFNFHNRLVDYSASTNVMTLSINNKINAQWSKTSAQIIQLNRTCVPTIFELQDVIIRLYHN